MRLNLLCCVLVLMAIPMAKQVEAQTGTQLRGNIQCGDIVEGEVVAGLSSTLELGTGVITFDDYLLQIQAGTRVNLTIEPLGNTFNVGVVLVDSGGNDVVYLNDVPDGQAEVFVDYPIGSSNQILRILGMAPNYVGAVTSGQFYNQAYQYGYGAAGLFFGAYRISLGCTLRDGTAIEPGDTPPDGGNGGGGPNIEPFSGFGFPGLHPVDFAAAFRLPLAADTANQGEIPTVGDAILGFYFNANAGDVLALSFERTAGNLNLGLVVLSADNQVAFMSALVSSTTLSTQFTLPSTGEYTIGIFRLDLIPPSAPEATRFTVQATLNP